MSPLDLGVFRIDAPLGEGGMGVVFRGRHVEQDVPVAVKVIHPDEAGREAVQRAFADEVRAVAGLDHPGIVLLFDQGVVAPDLAAQSEGRLVAGSPWLVMELASGGSLAGRPLPKSWDAVSALLLPLLDALAHAHARGVIHRDLKPGNILLGTGDDLRPGLKLTDFGIAQAVARFGRRDDAGSRERAGGTPSYMAPEQFQGQWRDQGPWTDLYSLGCLTWQLVTGQLPFTADSILGLAVAHMHAPLPTFAPRFPVPSGLDDLLRGLLEKAPARRFERAADVAAALSALSAVTGADEEDVDPALSVTVDIAPTLSVATNARPSGPRPTSRGLGVAEGRADASAPPPLVPPATWPPEHVPSHPFRLLGAGLGLPQLRPPPLVGRAPEQEVLRSALDGVAATRVPAAVLLHGPRGIGTSRLAGWLVQRAHELGRATALVAGAEGLRGLVGRATRTLGLDATGALERLEQLLPERTPTARAHRRRLADLVATDEHGGPDVLAAVSWSLAAFAERRPVIVWFDDCQHTPGAVQLTRTLLERVDLPVLVLLTADDRALATGIGAAEGVAALRAHPRTRALPVGPLDAASTRGLIDGLVGIGGGGRAALAERAAGNPLFAVELVRDRVARGLVRPGPVGFELVDAGAGLPDDLATLWGGAAEAARRALGPAGFSALQVAAVLGIRVHMDEWTDCLARAAIDARPAQVLEHLLASRAAEATPDGWRFAQGMVRDALVERIAPGTAVQWHACAAQMLAGRPHARRRDARLGRHLRAAGSPQEALGHLRAGVHHATVRGRDFGLAQQLLDEHASLLASLRAAGDVSDRFLLEAEVAGAAVRSDLCGATGRMSESARIGEAAFAGARALGDEGLLVDVYAMVIAAWLSLARFDAVIALVPEALELAARARPLRTVGLTRYMAVAQMRRGDLDAATTWAERSCAEAERLGLEGGRPPALRVLAEIATREGRLEEAEARIREALAGFEANGSGPGRSRMLNQLGELARHRGQLEEAVRWYEEGLEAAYELGAGLAVVAAFNLVLCRAQQGRWSDAWRLLQRHQVEARARRNPTLGLGVALLLLGVHAHRGSWERWDAQLQAARTLKEATGGFTEDDHRRCLALSLAVLDNLGEEARAARARTLEDPARP